jgi:hypothetical protein
MLITQATDCSFSKRSFFLFSAVSKEPGLKVIEGKVEIGSQYHFYMETLACIVRPVEDGQVGSRNFHLYIVQYSASASTTWACTLKLLRFLPNRNRLESLPLPFTSTLVWYFRASSLMPAYSDTAAIMVLKFYSTGSWIRTLILLNADQEFIHYLGKEYFKLIYLTNKSDLFFWCDIEFEFWREASKLTRFIKDVKMYLKAEWSQLIAHVRF